MSKPDSKLIDQTIEVWQPRYEEELTPEDARAMVGNVVAFFDVLRDWDSEPHSNGKESNTHGP
jgi:hypothetical protein